MNRSVCAGMAFVALTAATPAFAWLPVGIRGAGYIGLHLTLTACMGLATYWFPADAQSSRLLVLMGIAARIAAAVAPPFTSNDLHRYLWDGSVLLSGADPWVTTPNGLAGHAWPLPPDNRDIASLYPPLAMALFGLCAAAGPAASPWAWKGLVLLASLAILWVSTVDKGPQQRWLPLVALSPLLVLEGGVGAHLDLLSAAVVACAMTLTRRSSFFLGGVALGFGALVKFLPLVVLLPLVAAHGPRRGARAAVGAAAVVAVGYAVPLGMGYSPLGSLGRFVSHWRFGTPFTLVDRLSGPTAAATVSFVLVCLLLVLSVRRAFTEEMVAGLPYALAAPLAGSPVAFPWYLAPIAATSAAAPTALTLAWVTLAPLSYEVIDMYGLTGRFEPATWPLWAVTAGLLLAIAVDMRRPPGRKLARTSF